MISQKPLKALGALGAGTSLHALISRYSLCALVPSETLCALHSNKTLGTTDPLATQKTLAALIS